MADLEEVNRVRLSLGMKPLPVTGAGPQFKQVHDSETSSDEDDEPGSTLESRQAQGYDNWINLQSEKDTKAKREAKAEAVKKARDAAQKHVKLSGRGLGEADESGDVDAKTWLQQQKKRRRKAEKERLKWEREMAERETNFQEHTSADLAGVRVAHELDDFEGQGDQILILKDTTIDQNEEEGDELENIDLKERETLNDRLDVKKRKVAYDPSSLDENESTILKQYDEVIDGKTRKKFTLDGKGASLEERQAMRDTVGDRLKRQVISLEVAKDAPLSDYNEAIEIKVKRPKKTKSKSKRQRPLDEDDLIAETRSKESLNVEAMEVDNGGHPEPVHRNGEIFVDDDDLQASLAIQRRAALKKRKRTKPEDLARVLREESMAGLVKEEDDDAAGDEGGLVIDETTEFVANLQRSKGEEKVRSQPKSREKTPIKNEDSSEGEEARDIEMDWSKSELEEGREQESKVKHEPSMPIDDVNETGIGEEATLNQGIGATLNLLSQRGLIERSTDEDSNTLQRDRQRFLAEKRKREAEIERRARLQRERDRASGKLDHMSAREREEYARYENKQRDQNESRAITDVFNREYKPDVQLKYVDEFGRHMNQKEAFKHLSHQFHGKGSGKQKTEKHLKKIEDEKKRAAQSMLDSSEAKGMNNAQGATAKKNRQAGVRLA